MNSAIIEKLQKILAGTAEGSGCNEHEMNLRMAKAQKLAMEHNIDLGTIKVGVQDTTPEIETEVARVSSRNSNSRRPHHDNIAHVLMSCFQVKFIYTGGSGAAIVGEKVDVAIATYCYHWLDELFPKLHRSYCNALGISHTPADTVVRRRCYFEGLASGIISSNKRQVAAMASDDKNKYSLVLVKKEEIVERRYKDEFPDARQQRVCQRQHHEGAKQAGFGEGKKIKLNGGLAGGDDRRSLT